MKRKRYFRVIFILLGLLAFTGYQLAHEDLGENLVGDRLVGVFITRQSLNLFDIEEYLKDHIGNFSGGNTHVKRSEQYETRLYAKPKQRILTIEKTGEQHVVAGFVFEEVEGISFYAETVPETLEVDGFISLNSDPAISEKHMGISYGDEEEKTTLEGTVYMVGKNNHITSYINPVYQSSDGSVYATSGSGFSINSGGTANGIYTQTFDETVTITENGKTKKVSMSIKISIAAIFSPEEVVILQMDKDNKVVLRQEYMQGEVPETLVLQKDTNYIIVETYSHDKTGEVVVTRVLVDQYEETLTTFFEREDGICEERATQLTWQNQEDIDSEI